MTVVDALTVLTAKVPLAKTIGQAEGGGLSVEPNQVAKIFDVSEEQVQSIGDIHDVLSELQGQTHKAVIRGKLIEGISSTEIRRLSRPSGDTPASFEQCSRRWVMLDIDDVALPECFRDIDRKADEIIAHAVSFLPSEFQSAKCVYQWSGSMGVKKDKIRVHLWYWLDRPVSDLELKAWLSDSPVDHHLFNPVQIHYTANPILGDGVVDPIKTRVGLYAPAGSEEFVLVPANLSALQSRSAERSRQHVTSGNTVDPQGIVRDEMTHLVIDGRERFMFFKSNDATKELMVGRTSAGDFPTVDQIADRTWELFEAEADTSDSKWTRDHASKEAKRRHQELQDGTYSFVSRADTTILEPCSSPYVTIDLVTKDEGQQRLTNALKQFFDNVDEGKRLALRITMGAGKTRETIRQLQAYLANKSGQSIEIYVPRHDLAEQYVNDIESLEGDFCAEVIHVLPRTTVDAEAFSDMCERPDYARSLTAMGLGVFQNACRSNDGDHCEFYDTCQYLQQFRPPEQNTANHGNTVRILVHSYLGLPRNPVQSHPDLVIIDEAFLDVLIDTETKLTPTEIKKRIKTENFPKLGRWIVDALEEGEPVLKALRDEGVTRTDLAAVCLDDLMPAVTFDPTGNRPISKSGNGGLHRSLSLLLQILKEELALVPARDNVERLAYDPAKELIRLAYLKEIDLPETTPILCLDATADKTLLEEVLGPVKIEEISVKQNAVVTQVYDRTGSKAFWEGSTAPVEELLDVANTWETYGEKPLIVAHKALANRLQENDKRHAGMQVMHFGNLRGSNAAEDCSVIFLTGRNQPPMAEIDLKARALFWSADDPLQHDEGSQFKEEGDYETQPVKRLRGFVQSSRNTHPQSGVYVTSFSDDRIDALLAQTRDAETMQALGRLRLVHSAYQKRVFLLSNLPVEMPVDHLVEFNELMPDRLEYELLKHGNIPLTPQGLLKMRPDLTTNSSTARTHIERSQIPISKSILMFPSLANATIFEAKFRAGDQRLTEHRHLFLVRGKQDQGVVVGPSPDLDDIKTFLEQGDPDIAGSGWGKVQGLQVHFWGAGLQVPTP